MLFTGRFQAFGLKGCALLIFCAFAQRMYGAIPPPSTDTVPSPTTMDSPVPATSPRITPGHILNHKNPKYPGVMKAAHIQGDVVLHAIISKEGKITNLQVISSPDPALSESSLKAVRDWTYTPYTMDGLPIAVETTITVHFAMGKKN